MKEDGRGDGTRKGGAIRWSPVQWPGPHPSTRMQEGRGWGGGVQRMGVGSGGGQLPVHRTPRGPRCRPRGAVQIKERVAEGL